MRKSILVVSVLLGLGVSDAWAQQGDWAVMPYYSQTYLFGDTDFNHPDKMLSPGVGTTLQYGINDYLRVFGDVTFGSANGGNSFLYYENQHLQGVAGLQLDGIRMLGFDSKLGVYGDAGFGWNWTQSTSWETATGRVRKVPNEGAFSLAPVLAMGGGVSYSISNQVDIYGGYRTSWQYDNDWGDAYESGDHSDWLGQVSLGVRFSIFGHKRQMRVDQSDYDELVSARRRAESERDDAVAELNTARRQYDAQIEDLQAVLSNMNNNIDSLKQKFTILRQSDRGVSTYNVQNDDGTVTPGANLWRLVVGSYPTENAAIEFAIGEAVGPGDYEIIYIENLATYRVVYKSYSSLSVARQELDDVREIIPDAWIIRF